MWTSNSNMILDLLQAQQCSLLAPPPAPELFKLLSFLSLIFIDRFRISVGNLAFPSSYQRLLRKLSFSGAKLQTCLAFSIKFHAFYRSKSILGDISKVATISLPAPESQRRPLKCSAVK